MELTSPNGILIGSVVQNFKCFTPDLSIVDEHENNLYDIHGGCLRFPCFVEHHYDVSI